MVDQFLFFFIDTTSSWNCKLLLEYFHIKLIERIMKIQI